MFLLHSSNYGVYTENPGDSQRKVMGWRLGNRKPITTSPGQRRLMEKAHVAVKIGFQ
jgi:hypothetical protein